MLHIHGLKGMGTVRKPRMGLPEAKLEKDMNGGDIYPLQTTDQR